MTIKNLVIFKGNKIKKKTKIILKNKNLLY